MKIRLATLLLLLVLAPRTALAQFTPLPTTEAGTSDLTIAVQAAVTALNTLIAGINVNTINGNAPIPELTFDCDTGAGSQTCAGVPIAFTTSGGAVLAPGDAANGQDVDVTRLPALVAGSALIGKVDVQFAGTVPAAGSGAVSATTQRVVQASQSVFKSLTLDEVDEQASATAGELCSIWFTNTNTSTVWLHIYNATGAATTVGTTVPAFTIGMPGNTTDAITGALGTGNGCWAFTALTFSATTGFADNDAVAPTNDIILAAFYPMIKFLGALVLLMLLTALPAAAEITIDTGVGGTTIATAAAQYCSGAPNATIPAGDMVITVLHAHATGPSTADGPSTQTGIFDNSNGTDVTTGWVRLVEQYDEGGTNDAVTAIWLKVLTSSLETTEHVGCDTGSAASRGKFLEFYKATFSGPSQTYQIDGTAGGTASSTTYNSQSTPAQPNVQRLWLGAVTLQNVAGTISCPTNYTCTTTQEADTGSSGTSARGMMGYRTVTATTQAFTGTISGGVLSSAVIVGLDEVSTGGAVSRLHGRDSLLMRNGQ